jgi:hypothetical protein
MDSEDTVVVKNVPPPTILKQPEQFIPFLNKQSEPGDFIQAQSNVPRPGDRSAWLSEIKNNPRARAALEAPKMKNGGGKRKRRKSKRKQIRKSKRKQSKKSRKRSKTRRRR